MSGLFLDFCRKTLKDGCLGSLALFFWLFLAEKRYRKPSTRHVNTGINKVYWLQTHNRDSCSKALNLTPATIHLAQVEHIWFFIYLFLQNCL